MRERVDFIEVANEEHAEKLLGNLEIILKTHRVFESAAFNAEIYRRTNFLKSSVQAISAHYQITATYQTGIPSCVKVSVEIDAAAYTEVKTALRSVVYQVFGYAWN